jgi:hypothetical protein
MSMERNGDDDAGWGKLLTHPPELSGNPTSRDIWGKVGGMDKGVRILPIQYRNYIKGFNMPYNLTTWGLWLDFPSKGAADFYHA